MMRYNEVILPDMIESIKLGDSIPPFDHQDYNLEDPKKLTKFFYAIERIVRTSYAYRNFMDFLRKYTDMRSCAFFKNTNNIDTYSIHIEIHHSPLTLFDIVSTVYNKRLSLNQSVDEEDIAEEVMYLHYSMKVGLIPLSETVHQLVHSGFLFVPTTAPFGYYRQFVIEYEPYMDPELKRTLAANEAASINYNFAKETQVLRTHMVYIDPTGCWDFPKTEDIMGVLQNKLDSIDMEIQAHQDRLLQMDTLEPSTNTITEGGASTNANTSGSG